METRITNTYEKMEEEKRKRIEQLKHNEELLFKTLTFLSSYLVKDNVGYYDEIEIYKKIGFTDEDMEYFGLRDYELEKEINYFNGVETDEY